MQLVSLENGNLINAERVVAVISPDSAPAKRMMQECKKRASLIDATHGKKIQSVIITDNESVVLSFLPAEELLKRFNSKGGDGDAES